MALDSRAPSGSMIPTTQINILPSPTASTSKSNVAFVEEPEEIEPVSVQDLVRDPAPLSPTSGRRSPPPSARNSENREADTTSPTRKKGKKKASLTQLAKKDTGPFLGTWNPSLTLENTGSVARDHLASERTFLAYIRTSLTIASSGVGESFYVSYYSSFSQLILIVNHSLGSIIQCRITLQPKYRKVL